MTNQTDRTKLSLKDGFRPTEKDINNFRRVSTIPVPTIQVSGKVIHQAPQMSLKTVEPDPLQEPTDDEDLGETEIEFERVDADGEF